MSSKLFGAGADQIGLDAVHSCCRVSRSAASGLRRWRRADPPRQLAASGTQGTLRRRAHGPAPNPPHLQAQWFGWRPPLEHCVLIVSVVNSSRPALAHRLRVLNASARVTVGFAGRIEKPKRATVPAGSRRTRRSPGYRWRRLRQRLSSTASNHRIRPLGDAFPG